MKDWGITILRVIVGVVFMAHGWRKLAEAGFSGLAETFQSMAIPLPMISAVVVTLVELLGGLALLAGLFTRWAAAPLAATMLVALFHVHLGSGFFLPDGYEFVLTLLAALAALALAGPGAAAIDTALARRRMAQ